jgi:hypothetical protein
MTAREKVAAPAIAMMIVGCIGAVFCVFVAVVGGLGAAFGERSMAGADRMTGMLGNTIGVIVILGMAVVAVAAAICAWKMKNMDSYGVAIAACCLSMIPCYNSCCILGLGVGIWGLVVLLQEDVKAAFRERSAPTV